MSIQIKTIQSADAPSWDEYVHNHPRATLYHLSGWKNVINNTYAHKTYYLMAIKSNRKIKRMTTDIVGILPLVHLKRFLFGNSLISIPFFDLGGILADDKETEKALNTYWLMLCLDKQSILTAVIAEKYFAWLTLCCSY